MIKKITQIRRIKKVYRLLDKFLNGTFNDVNKLEHKLLEIKEHGLEGILLGIKYCSIDSVLETIEDLRFVDKCSRAELFFTFLDLFVN